MKLICWIICIWLTLQHLDMASWGFMDGCELEEQDNGDIKCLRCGRIAKRDRWEKVLEELTGRRDDK